MIKKANILFIIHLNQKKGEIKIRLLLLPFENTPNPMKELSESQLNPR